MILYANQQPMPLWARISIERLECDPSLRNPAMLNQLLDAYARIYGELVDVQMRNRVHALCKTKFENF